MFTLDFDEKFEFLSDIFDHLDDKGYHGFTVLDDLGELNFIEKVFYVLYIYDLEVQNGGLCQFFSNSSYIFAPIILQALQEVGAFEHQKLYENFIKDNDINIFDLSAFDVDDLSEFGALYDLYPFDDFDNSYIEMKPITDYLYDFYHQHIKYFDI